jgi:hypothetical protein
LPDVHRTRASCVFFGVFSTEANVIVLDYAQENGLYIHTTEFIIVEYELGKFDEV